VRTVAWSEQRDCKLDRIENCLEANQLTRAIGGGGEPFRFARYDCAEFSDSSTEQFKKLMRSDPEHEAESCSRRLSS